MCRAQTPSRVLDDGPRLVRPNRPMGMVPKAELYKRSRVYSFCNITYLNRIEH